MRIAPPPGRASSWRRRTCHEACPALRERVAAGTRRVRPGDRGLGGLGARPRHTKLPPSCAFGHPADALGRSRRALERGLLHVPRGARRLRNRLFARIPGGGRRGALAAPPGGGDAVRDRGRSGPDHRLRPDYEQLVRRHWDDLEDGHRGRPLLLPDDGQHDPRPDLRASVGDRAHALVRRQRENRVPARPASERAALRLCGVEGCDGTRDDRRHRGRLLRRSTRRYGAPGRSRVDNGRRKAVRKRRKWALLPVLVLAAAFALVGCGGGDDDDGEATPSEELTPVTLQSKWVVQAQFAGYYAAVDQGFYEDEGLDVTIRAGGPDIVPEQVVLGGQAEFGINWLDNLLATRDQGGDIVNVAQVFARSGMTEVTWKDTGLDQITDLRGKKVGVWLGGNEHKLFAALTKNGIDPQKDTEVVAQPFDMNLFLNREVDAAAAMTYNELAQVLETENPDTGELYQLSDLNVLKMSDLGTGALEDGIFVRDDWIADEANQGIAVRFLKASFKGWIYCRDNPDECVQYVLDAGPTLGEGHQRWMMNEINKLIWPNELGVGVMNPSDFETTSQIAVDYKIVTSPPVTDETYVTDYAEQAVQALKDEGEDVNGSDWTAPEVEVTPGGE